MSTEVRVRKSFRKVEQEHDDARSQGNKDPTELETLILAWKRICELPPDDPNSFFVIGGYHGEPFRGVCPLTEQVTTKLTGA